MKKKSCSIVYILILMMMVVLTTTGCRSTTEGEIENMKYSETEEVTNTVKLVTGHHEVILIELYPDIAPITVKNFQKLVSEKFYDGLIFHRVIRDFMIQTGDPTGTGTGGSTETIKGEFSLNGVSNHLQHKKGIVSMARKNDMDSASSQFFICVSDEVSYLDGAYAGFGKVIAGYSTVESISKVKTDSNSLPVNTQRIESIRFVNIK